MPLHASATSSGIVGNRIMFPSRKTGTPASGNKPAAIFEARICKGKVIWLKMISGIGIMRNKNSQGNNTSLKYLHPRNRTIRPTISISKELRARNNSLPIVPASRRKIAKKTIGSPHQVGSGDSRAIRARFLHTTYREKTGTRNPWEKLGSCHHCWARRRRTEK